MAYVRMEEKSLHMFAQQVCVRISGIHVCLPSCSQEDPESEYLVRLYVCEPDQASEGVDAVDPSIS